MIQRVLQNYPPHHRNARGYALNPNRGWFSVLVPVARTNLVANPSLETNSTGWAGFGATATLQRLAAGAATGTGSNVMMTSRGLYGGYCDDASAGDSLGYNGVGLTSGTIYAVSADFFAYPSNIGRTFRLEVRSGGGAVLARREFTATGFWQRPTLYYAETANATRLIHVVDVAGASLFVVDGLQVEAIQAGETASTYIDGDQLGLVPNQFPPAYLWSGIPHASSSSRSGQTRAGGMVVNIQDTFRLFLTGIIGLGLTTPQHVSTEYALLDGAQYQYSRKPTRQFSLVGQMNALDPQQLRTSRADLADLFDRDLIATDQPLILRYQAYDCLKEISDEAEIVGIYTGGLEGNDNNHFEQDVALTFTQYLPYIRSSLDSAATLAAQNTVANANRVLYRSPGGNWLALGTGATGGSVYAVARGQDGKLYLGGDFTLFGGVANTVRAASYDPATGTIAALGTGAASGLVIDIQVAPDGKIWYTGTFANMGGVAAADYVGVWDPVGLSWSAPGTPPIVTASGPLSPAGTAFGGDGLFYLASGGASGVQKWSGAAWSSVGVGSSVPFSAVRTPNGNIAVGFNGISNIGAATGSAVNIYNVTTGVWSAVGALNISVLSLAYDVSGALYAAGTNGIWRFTGAAWVQILTVTGGTPVVTDVSYNPLSGLLWASGRFTTVDGVVYPDSFFVWSGSSAILPDVDLPGTAGTTIVGTVQSFPDGSVVVGYDASGSATAAATATITNTGTARAYPTIVITGPTAAASARIYQIANITTGRRILMNYTILAGETATLVFQPDNLSFTSDVQGNIANTILASSDEADFFLQPGSNTMSLLASASSIATTIRWRNNYASLDDLIR